jgi:hypothetical protein
MARGKVPIHALKRSSESDVFQSDSRYPQKKLVLKKTVRSCKYLFTRSEQRRMAEEAGLSMKKANADAAFGGERNIALIYL